MYLQCKDFNAGFPKMARLSIVGFLQQPGEVRHGHLECFVQFQHTGW